MQAKPVPEFMKRYMENIGYECYGDYAALSRRYHEDIAHYHEHIHPAKMQWASDYARSTGTRNTFDGSRELYAIEERYKEKAMEIGCQHGYRMPDEDVMYSRELTAEEYDLSPNDLLAKEAHSEFEARKGIMLEAKQYERDFIEMEFGEGPKKQSFPDIKEYHNDNEPELKEPEKEITEPETMEEPEEPKHPVSSRFAQKFNNFQMAKEEIETPQPGSRFLSSLPSQKTRPEEPDIKDTGQKFKDEGPEMCYDMR